MIIFSKGMKMTGNSNLSPFRAVVFLLAVLIGLAGVCHSEMYRWVDEAGKVHYTDNLFNVPSQNLPEVRTYEETGNGSANGEIPLKKLGAGYVVEVRLNALYTVNLVVDTGASMTLISPSALGAAQIELTEGRSVTIRTANGEANAKLANIDSITVGAFKRGPFDVVAHDARLGDADGLLGMDFLGNYRVEILSMGPTLKLSPQ
jgi:clan AA aspartic protease (TIGR02281 family)